MTRDADVLPYDRNSPVNQAVRWLCWLIVIWSAVVVVRHGLYWSGVSLMSSSVNAALKPPNGPFSFFRENRLPLLAAGIEVLGLTFATFMAIRTLRGGRKGFWVEYGCLIAVIGVLLAVLLVLRDGSPASVLFRNPGARATLNLLWRCWSTLANATVPAFCLVALIRTR